MCLLPLLSLACAATDPAMQTASAKLETLTSTRGPFAAEAREMGEPMALVTGGWPRVSFHLAAGTSTVVRTGCELVQRLAAARTGGAIPFAAEGDTEGAIYAVVGESGPTVERLRRAGLTVVPEVGPQGFVIQRLTVDAHPVLVVWSPSGLGCRYGLIELARSLEFSGRDCTTRIQRVVSRPFFPLRIYYLNFGEHLQNRYNVNAVYDSPEYRWSLDEWKRFVDMIAAMRFNVFEFWLVPTLFSPEALEGGALQTEFAATMHAVIDYAHEQGLMVEALHAINTVGSDWRYYCPNVPEEREMILRLWDHWTRALSNADIVGLFPGDPGGCTKNGCDHRTFVELCLEIVGRTRPNGDFVYEVNTWGTPFWGWGLPSWEGTPERVRESLEYFIGRLPEFPKETFVGMCMGLNPESYGDALGFGPGAGGDTREYVERISRIRPVATWDYAASEGEMTVVPRFRVAKIIERRNAEAERAYAGGINYTMSPALNQLQPFAAAECYWNPDRTVEAIVESYSRLAFGEGNAGLGMKVFPYTEVVGDWGGGGWQGGMADLAAQLGKARVALAAALAPAECPLLLFPSPGEALANLRWHVNLLADLAAAGRDIEEARELAASVGRPPTDETALTDLEYLSAGLLASPGRDRLRGLLARIRAADLPALRQRYFEHVYGIYNQVGKPVDPRAWGATDVLFDRFGAGFAVARQPSRLTRLLAHRGSPHFCLDLGNPRSEREWQLAGWVVAGDLDGETWRASTDAPGVARRSYFIDAGYRHLVIRIADDLCGGSKSVAVNGVPVGTFVRPAKRIEWTTQQYEIPRGALHDGELVIEFTGFGVAISDVAFVTEPLTEDDLRALAE